MQRYGFYLCSLFTAVAILAACSAQAGPSSDVALGASSLPAATPAPTPDPYQHFNRAMFAFNDNIDSHFLRPIATLYTKIMPRPLYIGIHNVFNNIETLPTIANDLLQLNFYQATSDAWRFAFNTTLGVGGLFDVATHLSLPLYSNDFGLTLAHWGYKQSAYLVLPFWGPNTVRDGIGLPVDYYAFSVYPYIHPTSARYGVYALSVIDARAQLLQYQNVLDAVAFDKYVFVRNAYMQRRAYEIEQTFHRRHRDQYQAVAAPAPLS